MAAVRKLAAERRSSVSSAQPENDASRAIRLPANSREATKLMHEIYSDLMKDWELKSAKTPVYSKHYWKWNEPVLINKFHPVDQLLVSGWSHSEDDRVWSDGSHAQMKIPPPPAEIDSIILTVSMTPYCEKELTRQRIFVYHDERPIAAFSARTRGDYEMLIFLENHPRDTAVVLDWHFPDASSPANLEGTSDSRQLGVALHKITTHTI